MKDMKKLTDMEKTTKLSLLEELKSMLEEPGDIPSKAQKVTVMAKDKHGLEEGLDKAKSVLHDMTPDEDQEEDGPAAMKSMEEEDSEEHDDKAPDETDVPEQLRGKGLTAKEVEALKSLLKLK